jgi:predicted  nucleic acid-binding Zn-ribbon protein
VQRRLAANPQLAAARARLEALRKSEQEASAAQRGLEAELSDVEAKIGRDQTRMYSGQIVDPRELASLEREIEHYKGRQDELEGRCLEQMELTDTLRQQLADAGRRVDELRERWEADQPALSRQVAGLTDRLSGLRTEREQLAGSIEPRSLDHYRRLRTSLGHAVSRISGGVCQWCRVSIPPKDVQHVHAGALVTCSNCGRILYDE